MKNYSLRDAVCLLIWNPIESHRFTCSTMAVNCLNSFIYYFISIIGRNPVQSISQANVRRNNKRLRLSIDNITDLPVPVALWIYDDNQFGSNLPFKCATRIVDRFVHHPNNIKIFYSIFYINTDLRKSIPFVLPQQIFQIGQLYILGLPRKFSTMSGRRMKATVKQALQNANLIDSHIVIVGLSNGFSHYITTYEEYQQQRYEGASTLYGPHLLAAYHQIFDDLTRKLALNQTVPLPLDMRGKTFSFVPPPI